MVRQTTAITTGVTHIGTMKSTRKKRPARTSFHSMSASMKPSRYSKTMQKSTIR